MEEAQRTCKHTFLPLLLSLLVQMHFWAGLDLATFCQRLEVNFACIFLSFMYSKTSKTPKTPASSEQTQNMMQTKELCMGWECSRNVCRRCQGMPIRHRASIVQQAMKMACKGSCVLLDGARSASEANFHQNPQKFQNLRKST